MKSKIKPRIPSGFYELLPGDQIEFNKIIDKIRSVYELFGFLPIETPAIEFTEILLAKGGGETEKQIYRLDKEGDDLSLHFDLTVPLARYIAEHLKELAFPFRCYQIQKVWRGERSQKGRYREFYQCDIDVIGTESILADAEMPAIIYQVFKNLGVEDFTVRINNRKILNGFLQSLDLGQKNTEILRIIDKLGKQGVPETIKQLKGADVNDDQVAAIFNLVQMEGTPQKIIKKIDSLGVNNPLFKEGKKETEELVNAIQGFNIPNKYWRIDLSIVRGLDYYTGTVYETTLNNFPEIGSICSGGRYDDLISYYTEEKLTGVGISIGLTRLFSKFKDLNIFNLKTKAIASVLVVALDEKYKNDGINLATKLRENEINTEMYFNSGKLEKPIKYADKLGIPFVALLGENEAKSNKISIKNLATGEQQTLILETAIKVIKNER